MDDRVRYLIYCIETYKHQRNMNGVQVYEHFKKYDFFGYIMDLYELLHIQGTKRLMEELDEYQLSQETV